MGAYYLQAGTIQIAFSGAGVTASVTGWTATQLTLQTTVDLAADTL